MHQKQQRNINRSTDTIASFLLKTYQILQHPEYERMISWDKNNVGFIIHDVLSFTRQILPKYFRHSNFSSFVRQLNMYDFHKVKQQNQSLVFKNPLFCKGQQHNLKFIRRKAAKKIGGHRRQTSNEKNDVQNEKYQNLLKSFKKSIESQINQSCSFYERSIQLVKDSRTSNENKLKNIQSINKFIQNTKKENSNKKDQQQQNKSFSQGQTQSQILNSDALLILRQQNYKSNKNIQHWLNDYIQIQKKKLKYVSSFNSQLSKCLEKKHLESHRFGSQNINESNEEGQEQVSGHFQSGKPQKIESFNEQFKEVDPLQKKNSLVGNANVAFVVPKRLGFSSLSPSFGNGTKSLFSQFLNQSPFASQNKKQSDSNNNEGQSMSQSNSDNSLQNSLQKDNQKNIQENEQSQNNISNHSKQ